MGEEQMNWDLLVSFRIPGPGVPMGRPRFNRYSGRARTPEKTRRYLWLVQAMWRKCYVEQVKRSVALDLQVEDLAVSYLHNENNEA